LQQAPAAPIVRAMSEHSKIEAEILRLTAERGPEGSICPSEAARAVTPEWRQKLTAVRRAAVRLAQAGRIDILRKGKPVDPGGDIKGVIRLRTRPGPDAEPAT
jgi:hypothetical protein